QRRQRPPHRRAPDLFVAEEPRDLVPERARLARSPVVVRGLAHEVEALGGARARGVEEVAVPRDAVRLDEPRVGKAATLVVVEERRGLRPPRKRPFLEAEDENDVEAARAGAQEVEHRDAAGLATVGAANGGTLERADDV